MTHSLSQSLGGGSPVAWARDWLTRANFPVTLDNLRVVYSWEYAESGAGGGMWNPLNTTQGGYPGETNANSVGVKNYVRRDDGLDANARVIRNGFYRDAVSWFANGTNAIATRDAIVRSPWGTKVLPLLALPGPQPLEGTVQLTNATNKDGRLEMFALDGAGNLHNVYQTAPGGPWSPWVGFPGGPFVAVTCGRNGDGRLELGAETPGGAFQHCWQEKPGGPWSPWVPLP